MALLPFLNDVHSLPDSSGLVHPDAVFTLVQRCISAESLANLPQGRVFECTLALNARYATHTCSSRLIEGAGVE